LYIENIESLCALLRSLLELLDEALHNQGIIHISQFFHHNVLGKHEPVLQIMATIHHLIESILLSKHCKELDIYSALLLLQSILLSHESL